MFNLKNEEMLATLGLEQCWFYAEPVDDRRKIGSLVEIFCQDIITGMPVGEVCCFYIRNRDYVKLLKSTPEGWELGILTPEASKPFLELEWVVGNY